MKKYITVLLLAASTALADPIIMYISQTETNISVTASNLVTPNSYYLWATRALPDGWLFVTPFNGGNKPPYGSTNSYVLTFTKESLFTNNAPILFFRAQDITPMIAEQQRLAMLVINLFQ